jgi:hypothetical protein
MPKNCVECNRIGLQQIIDCQLIFSGAANCGRHPNCPLTEIVTCENCKHRDPEDKSCDCGHAIKWSSPRNDNFYCADAERRE